MTSQRFSNKLSSKFDFKSCFRPLIVPALVLAFAMFNNIVVVVNYLKDLSASFGKEVRFFGHTISKGYINCFFNSDDYGPMLILALCFVGFLFALASFVPFLKKRNCNFYLSSPVTRKDLFKNRVLSSILTMSSILFVAVVVITIMNFIASDNPAFVIKWAVAYYFECLIYMFASFAIFSFALAFSYTIIEGIIFGAGIYMLPTGVAFAFDIIYDVFLKTYIREPFSNEFMWGEYNSFSNISLLKQLSIVNPLFLGADIKTHQLYETIIEQANSEGNNACTLPNIYQIIPLIVWAVIISVFIIVAKKIFVNRKAENTGLHASNKLVNLYIATGFAVGISAICASAFSMQHRWVSFVAAVVSFAIAFAAFYSVSIRKIKHSKKAIAYFGSATALFAIFLSLLCFGGFGYDSYVPDAKDVEMVAITGSTSASGATILHDDGMDILPVRNGYVANGMAIFTEEEDIQKTVDLAKNFNRTTDNMTRSSTFVMYQLKNGKRVYRKYRTMDSEVKKSILTLTDTKEYKDTQRYIITGENPTDFDKKLTKYGFTGGDFFCSSLAYVDQLEYLGEYYTANYNSMLIKNAQAVVGVVGTKEIQIENNKKLRKALAEDYYNATSDEIYFTKQKAVCYVGFRNDESSGADAFMIYPSMKNTLKYLGSIGVLDDIKEFKDYNEIEGVYLANYGSDINNPYYYDDQNNDDVFVGGELFYQAEYGDIDDEYGIEAVYGKGKFITDKAQIKEIINNSTPLKYVSSEDNIVVIKLSGSNNSYYIPLVMLNN